MSVPEDNPFKIEPARRFKLPLWGVLALLVIIVIAAFASSVTFGFINYDDPHYITENPNVNTGVSLGNIKWALVSTGETNLWSPLTFMSHQFDVALFGLRPGWHHAVNVLWHALATALFFLVALKLTKSSFWSFFVALIWAIHPEKVQSVAWLSERKDVLSGAMFFASLLAFICWKLRPVKNPALYVVSLSCFVLALLSKPSVVPLPLILYLLFYLNPKEFLSSLREAALPLLPFFTAAVLASGIAIYFQSEGGLGGVGENLSIARRAANLVATYVFYIERFVWPIPHQLWFVAPGSVSGYIKAGGTLCVLAPLLIWLGTKEKLILSGAAIYTLLWLPVSGIVSVSHYYVADRYSYLPQIGLVFVVMGLLRLSTRSSRNLLSVGIALGAFSVFLLSIQQMQLPLWKDSETLFSHEMAVNPGSLLAPIHYGEEFKDTDPEKALSYYRKARDNDPGAGIATAKMGMMLKKLGRPDEALESFKAATKASAPVKEGWTQMLLLQVELERYEDADETVRRGTEAHPTNWDFIMNGGNYFLLVREQPETALEYFLRAHALAPGDSRAVEAVAGCYRLLGNESEARRFEEMFGARRN